MAQMARAKRLTGNNPLSYLGVDPITPPDFVINNDSPTTNDSNFNLGTLWLNESTQAIYMLTNLDAGVATWTLIGIATSGVTDFITDAGTAITVGSTINDLGDANVIQTTGSGSTVTTSLMNGTNGQLIIGGGTKPIWASLTSGDASVTITTGANTIDLSAAAGSGTSTFHTGSGDATALSNAITIAGGLNIATSGSSHTVTVALTGTVGVTHGGTGLATATQGDLLYASAANTYSALAKDTNATRYLSNTGSSNNPAWAQINISNGVTGTLPVANGGTGDTSLTAHNILVGNGTSAVGLIPPSATVGVPLISQGSSADPVFGTALVAGGGTGNTTFTAYSVITAGTTATGPFQNVSGVGTAGQLLVSNGAGALPSWQTGSGATINITGDTGGALSASAFTFTGGTTGLTFNGSGTTETLVFAGITANGGTVSLATDATTSTVNVGTGAGAKTVSLGSTTTSSSLALKYGTADFSLASATGNVMVAQDTGEINYPLQPAFLAVLSSQDDNVTGNGASYTIGTNVALTEIFDQNGDFNTNGTFTAPVTGRYQFNGLTRLVNSIAAYDINLKIVTSNRTYSSTLVRAAISGSLLQVSNNVLADMDAGDTTTFTVLAEGESGNILDLSATLNSNNFSGYLAC